MVPPRTVIESPGAEHVSTLHASPSDSSYNFWTSTTLPNTEVVSLA
jgi:hypothetical protein